MAAGLADVLAGRINPGSGVDFETDLDHMRDAYVAMDERRAIKALVTIGAVVKLTLRALHRPEEQRHEGRSVCSARAKWAHMNTDTSPRLGDVSH
jgi:hypothetical protein